MPDTGPKKYNIAESLNRIVRAFIGEVAPSDAVGSLAGSVLSVDDALSKFAEIAEDRDSEETGQLPVGWTVPIASVQNSSITQRGVIETATNTEVEAGTDTERAVTPAGLASALLSGIEYGEIYNNSTGTAVVVLSTGWQKVTGSFQGETLSSDNVVPDYANDRITLNHVGTFFVGLQTSFSGSTSAVIEAAVYLDGVRQESVRFRRKLGTGGDVGSASAIGIVQVTGTAMNLELYARADTGTPDFKIEAGQLWTYALP